MSMISEEILAKQRAYAARPYAVYWTDSHFSGESRFHTADDAFDYIQQMWAHIRKEVATYRYRESHLYRSYLETPEGRYSLRYVLLCDDVSSYYDKTLPSKL